MNRLTAILIVSAAAFAAASGCSQLRVISEAQLLEYASTPYDKGAHGAPRQILGVLNDVNVVVDFVCSDLCPAYTVRIIHFDVEPDARCAEVGGVEREVIVPVAITARSKAFCFPEVLTRNWNAYIR
jgi:hypothetical protein